jgi:hypothetical protein
MIKPWCKKFGDLELNGICSPAIASCYLEAMGFLNCPPCQLKESLAFFVDESIGLITQKLVSKWPSKRE